MLSNVAQNYAASMLDAYLESETTEFTTQDIGTNALVWIELEQAGIIKIRNGIAILNPDAIIQDAFPEDGPED